MATCVYCGHNGPDLDFNREHVLPEAFGRFNGALTLHKAVCIPCNSYFGETLDVELSRKAIEGLERYHWGVKAPAEIRRFRFDHIKLRAAEEGDFRGAPVQLYYNAELDRILARPTPGVAIHNAVGDDFTHFSLDEIERGAWTKSPVDWEQGIKIYGPDDVVARIRSVLFDQGVRPTKFRPLEAPEGDIKIDQEFHITAIMKRAIAKIAFNYMTCRQGSDFALLHQFTPIRRFIRFGEEPPLSPVKSKMDLPFRSSAPPDQRPVVHWLGLTGHQSHRNLLGTVMLFGFMNHVVILAQDFPGPWPELPLAHIYMTKTLTAREMTPANPRWRHPNTES